MRTLEVKRAHLTFICDVLTPLRLFKGKYPIAWSLLFGLLLIMWNQLKGLFIGAAYMWPISVHVDNLLYVSLIIVFIEMHLLSPTLLFLLFPFTTKAPRHIYTTAR